MANLSIRMYSDCLKRSVTFQMIIPNDPRPEIPLATPAEDGTAKAAGGMKTLFLLHGYTGDSWKWVPEELAAQYNFAIVIPSGENGFWIDGQSTGHAFGRFLGEELVAYIRKTFGLAKTKEETYVMGFSMGGFGALHAALKYPDTFGKVAAWSSALIVHEVAGMTPGYDNGMANYEYYRECFGEPAEVLESDKNPETLVRKLKEAGREFPEIIMACGTEDFLIERNRELHRFLEQQGVAHEYWEDTGIHDMIFWSKCVQKYVPVLFG